LDIRGWRATSPRRCGPNRSGSGSTSGCARPNFNNILTVILGLCETAAIGLDPAGMARHDLDGIAAAGRRATDLTRQLLAFSRRQVITPQLVDMRAHLVSLEGMLRRAATEQIELRLNLAESLWPVLVDPTQIDQVLINLVANARDAMPHGGVVTVEASNVEVDDRAAAGQSGLARGHYVRLEVADNGAGMDEQTLKNVFVPFFTTKPDGAGTGLGLASVYGILKQNDGAVTVRSQLGRGTTVTVYWPRDDGAGPSAPAPAVVSPSAPSRRLTVLLVEDNDQVRIVVRRLLARLGHRVLEARSPSTAIALCETLGERGIDVLLTDVVMPEMNGLVLSERIRELQPTVVTVLMSGYPDGIARADTEARRSDVLFLAKPFDQTSLDATLRRALGGGVDHRPGTGPT
jgi:CheY-like chemotaxis protein